MADKLLVDRFPYYLPLTRLRIHGKQTTKTALGGPPTVVSEVAVDLVTAADPDHPRYIEDADSLFADSKLAVEATEHGLLTSTNASSTGKLGTIVTNIFGTILRFSLFFGGGIVPLLASAPNEKVTGTPEQEYENKFPELAAARKAAKLAVSTLLKKIATLSADLAELSGDDLKKARERIATLADALAALRKEAEALEAHFTAWKAGTERTTVTERDYVVGIGELPEEGKVRELRNKTEAEIKEALKTLGDLFWALRVVVADSKESQDPNSKLPKLDKDGPLEERDDARGIEFRLPRPTTLSFFELRPTADPERFDAVLKERRSVAVVDPRCTTTFLSIKSSVWSERSLDIEFAANGGVRKIATNHKSELEAVTAALSKLPAEALQAVKDANVFVDERQKLALQAIEQRIEDLKKQKDEALARIALNETLATEAQAAELKRIEQDIALLQKQVQLKQAAGTADAAVDIKLLEIQEDLVSARTALEKAEIERLKVEAALKKAKDNPPPPAAGG